MNRFSEVFGSWLADFGLLATIFLLLVCVGLRFPREPARRLAVSWAAVVGLLALAILAALPGWPRVPPGTALAAVADLLRPDRTATPATLPAQAATRPAEVARFDGSPLIERLPADGPLPTRDHPANGSLAEPSLVLSPSSANLPLLLATRLYGAGALLVALWLGVGAVQVVKLRRQAAEAPASRRAALSRIVGDGRKPPLLRLSARLALPVAVGLLRPTIVLPTRFAQTEPPHRLEAALAHEWSHVRRCDLWLLALSRLLLLVLFPHPLFWWLRRQVGRDQEALADADAALVCNPLTYAETLVSWARTAAARPALAAALGLWERRSQLNWRIAMLLNPAFHVETACRRRWRLAVTAMTALTVLTLSALTLRPAASASSQPVSIPSASADASPAEEKSASGSQQAPANQGQGDPPPPGVARVFGSERFRTCGTPSDAALSPDGKLIATAERNHVQLTDLTTGRAVNVLETNIGYVFSLAFSPDGKRLALGSYSPFDVNNKPSGTAFLEVWDLPSNKILFTVPADQEDVTTILYTSDSRTLITFTMDGKIKYWDPDAGKLLREIEAHANASEVVHGAVWQSLLARSSDDKYLATGGVDGLVKVWDLATGQLLHTLQANPSQERRVVVWAVAISPDGTLLAAASVPFGKPADDRVRIWDLPSGKLLHTIQSQQRAPQLLTGNLGFSPDSRRLAVGISLTGKGGVIELRDSKTGELQSELISDAFSRNFAFTSDNRSLVAATSHGIKL